MLNDKLYTAAQKMRQVRLWEIQKESVVNTYGVNCINTWRKDDIKEKMVAKSHDLSVWTTMYVFCFTRLIWLLTWLLIFIRLISQNFRQVKIQQNMRNKENNAHIIRGKYLIICLLQKRNIYWPLVHHLSREAIKQKKI